MIITNNMENQGEKLHGYIKKRILFTNNEYCIKKQKKI